MRLSSELFLGAQVVDPKEVNQSNAAFWSSVTYDAQARPIAAPTTALLRWDRYGAALPVRRDR